MIGSLYNRKGYPQPSISYDTRLTPWEHLHHPINHPCHHNTRLTPWEKPRPTLSALSVPRVCPLSPLGIHPSPMRVISENPQLCHSMSLEGPMFPFSEECLHEAATINTSKLGFAQEGRHKHDLGFLDSHILSTLLQHLQARR